MQIITTSTLLIETNNHLSTAAYFQKKFDTDRQKMKRKKEVLAGMLMKSDLREESW